MFKFGLREYRRLELFPCRCCNGRHAYFVPSGKLCVTIFQTVLFGIFDDLLEGDAKDDDAFAIKVEGRA